MGARQGEPPPASCAAESWAPPGQQAPTRAAELPSTLRPPPSANRAHRTPPWAHQSRPHSHPPRHTSSGQGCSGPNPCSGTRPPHRSSGLQGTGRGVLSRNRRARGERPGEGVSAGRMQPQPLQGKIQLLTAVGRLIAAVHTVIVPVTDPDAGDAALGDRALELVGGAGYLSCKVEESMRALPLCPSSSSWSQSGGRNGNARSGTSGSAVCPY